MAEKTIQTHEGSITIGGPKAPTEEAPETNIAYSSPYMEQLAKAQAQALADAANPKESFRGPDWADLPNFYCPLCNYATLDGDNAVLTHAAFQHPGIDVSLVKAAVVAETEEEAKADKEDKPDG